MFVCVCNGVTERQIREAAYEGACSMTELSARLGVGAGCGACAGGCRRLDGNPLHCHRRGARP